MHIGYLGGTKLVVGVFDAFLHAAFKIEAERFAVCQLYGTPYNEGGGAGLFVAGVIGWYQIVGGLAVPHHQQGRLYIGAARGVDAQQHALSPFDSFATDARLHYLGGAVFFSFQGQYLTVKL